MQYSGGTPLGAICGRGDLDPDKPRAYGCIDTKVTNFLSARNLEAEGGEPLGREESRVTGGREGASPHAVCGLGERSLCSPHCPRRAVVGPTHSGGHLPFRWRGKLAAAVKHAGQPEEFDTEFERLTPDVRQWGELGGSLERSTGGAAEVA